jgi:hypothetical protein
VSASPAKEIMDWLEKLGLPEYGDHFAENGMMSRHFPT